MKQVHGVPALLSLFFPGLGQLVKGQWDRAVLVWILVLGPWIVLGVIVVPRAYGYALLPGLDDILLSMLRSPFLPVVLLLNLIVQLWAIVDAYNWPV